MFQTKNFPHEILCTKGLFYFLQETIATSHSGEKCLSRILRAVGGRARRYGGEAQSLEIEKQEMKN